MITITFKSEDGACRGFDAFGHAGYAPEGRDIVCAAVSALTQGTVSAIKELSSCKVTEEGGSGSLKFRIYNSDQTAIILLAGLEIALQDIQTEYGTYVEVCHG